MMLQVVAQKLDCSARDKDGAFKAVHDFVVKAPPDGGQQVILLSTGLLPVFTSMKQPVP